MTHKIIIPFGAGQKRVQYIFRDEFTDERAAGAVNGTLSTDGKAVRTVVDTENKLSISGGELVCAGGKSTPADGNPGIWYPAIARKAGVFYYCKVLMSSGGYGKFGFDSNQSGNAGAENFTNSSVSEFAISNYSETQLFAKSLPQNCEIVIILRSSGALFLEKISGIWKLVHEFFNESTGTLYPCAITYTQAFRVDKIRLAQLPAPFTDDYGIATQRLVGTRSAGEAFSHEANCLIGYTAVTLPSVSTYLEVHFRKQSSSNRWQVIVTNDGILLLHEIVGGVQTTRGSAGAGTVTAGNKIVILADGTTISVYVNNVLKITYSSASNFQNETSGLLFSIGTGGSISDIVTWPRVLPSYLQSMLNRYVK